MDRQELIQRYNNGERSFRDEDLAGIDLGGANLSGIDLTGAILREATLNEAILTKAALGYTTLIEAKLDKAHLPGANLTHASLNGAHLIEAALIEADLSEADLNEAVLFKAILYKANLREADLRWTDLREADLRWTDLCAADLREAQLSGVRLDGALYDPGTRWPAGFDPSAAGAVNKFGMMIERIKHVVVIMLENRGFDSVLGYLYSPNDPPKQNIPPVKPNEPPFHGLQFVDTKSLSNTLVHAGQTIRQPPVPTVRATNSPGTDPGEEYHHVNVQLFGSETLPAGHPHPEMKGFLQDYSTLCQGDLEAIKQIMHMYTPADLPVLNGLAKAYAVSDLWFASVPTQTNANRAFSICGTSMGLVDNGFLSPNKVQAKLADDRFNTDTIWNVLARHGSSDWAVFWEDVYPPVISSVPYTRRIFPHLEHISNVGSHFHKMDRFFEMAEAGQLPAFSYIEPAWGGAILNDMVSIMGNEYHPPSDVRVNP